VERVRRNSPSCRRAFSWPEGPAAFDALAVTTVIRSRARLQFRRSPGAQDGPRHGDGSSTGGLAQEARSGDQRRSDQHISGCDQRCRRSRAGLTEGDARQSGRVEVRHPHSTRSSRKRCSAPGRWRTGRSRSPATPLKHSVLLQLPKPFRPAAPVAFLEWADRGKRFTVPGDRCTFTLFAGGAHDLVQPGIERGPRSRCPGCVGSTKPYRRGSASVIIGG
jgi:hypothetical protein